ncbi:cytochrome P450 [Colletotrichum tofieldiae]|nr:cytochrome P450 [Colletotrichum tofieldiae]
MALFDLPSGFDAGSAPLYLAVVCCMEPPPRVPGPARREVLLLLDHVQRPFRETGEHFTKLNRKHGPLVRIGPNDLVTDDPDIIRRMNGARSTYGRSSWYDSVKLNPYEDSMFSLRDVAAHDKLKAKCAGGYAGKENPALEDGVDSQIANAVDLIRRKYITTGDEVKPMDLGKVTQFFTLDAITKVAYGKEFGYLATDSDVYDYISTTETAIPYLQLCSEVPYLQKIIFSKLVLGTVGQNTRTRADWAS